MPDGKPANEFAFNGEPKNKEFAEKIIAGTHESWRKLMSGSSETGGLSITNTSLSNTASVDQENANGIISEVRIKSIHIKRKEWYKLYGLFKISFQHVKAP